MSTVLNVWIGAGGVFSGLSPIKKNYTDIYCNATSNYLTMNSNFTYYESDHEIRKFEESYLPFR